MSELQGNRTAELAEIDRRLSRLVRRIERLSQELGTMREDRRLHAQGYFRGLQEQRHEIDRNLSHLRRMDEASWDEKRSKVEGQINDLARRVAEVAS